MGQELDSVNEFDPLVSDLASDAPTALSVM
jgi:hypothetical protein